jgi:hypothetical protein
VGQWPIKSSKRCVPVVFLLHRVHQFIAPQHTAEIDIDIGLRGQDVSASVSIPSDPRGIGINLRGRELDIQR